MIWKSLKVLISYDGGDANRNSIDAKLYGQSLQGIDRMVSDCLIIFSSRRLPKRGERSPLILKVKEAEAGSYGTPAYYQEISDTLAMGVPILTAVGPEIISHYVSTVLDYFRGRSNSVDLAISKMAQMHEDSMSAMVKKNTDTLAVIDRMDERRSRETMEIIDVLRRAIKGSGAAAVDYVAPIGKSVDTASFLSGDRPAITVDKEGADAIRDSQKLDWNSIENVVLRTDGFKFHSNGLSVENPEGDGFMMAEVVDPAFEEESNAYTLAAQKKARIEVLARKGYKNGRLAKIQILNFGRELNDEP